MSPPTDLYTPWREDLASLEARSVGRGEIGDAIDAAIDGFIAGRNPTHLYLFGPRGLGKSHILALAWCRAKPRLQEAGVAGVLVPEDIPKLGSADAILARVESIHEGARWQRWRAGPRTLAQGPLVVFFEGLDRQLEALHEDERRKLRARLDERGPFLLITTGISLMEAFTSRETAFFGAFSPWPVPPLTQGEAEDLLNRTAGDATRAEAWPARRQTLLGLAGGSPRTLVALGLACADAPQGQASEQLHVVVQRFASHYQSCFRDLSAQQQQLVECLAMAPRELGPTELGEMIGVGTSHASGQARRLVDAGVLLARQEGRNAWYRLVDPLLRYWMEDRNAPWEQTRVGMMSRLMEVVLSPPQPLNLGKVDPDPTMDAVIAELLGRSPPQRRRIWTTLASSFYDAAQHEDAARLEQIVSQAERSPPPPELLVQMAARTRPEQDVVRRSLGRLLANQHLEVIPVAWSFERELSAGDALREAFAVLVQRLAGSARLHPTPRLAWDHVRDIVVGVLHGAKHRDEPLGPHLDEIWQLAQIPVLRAHFLLPGPGPNTSPVLAPDDLLASGLGEAPIDLDLLANAALLRGHRGLMGAVVHRATQSEAPALPFCALPGVCAPIAADHLGRWQCRALRQRAGAQIRAISWAGSWAALSDDVWEDLLESLLPSGHPADGGVPSPGQELALWVALIALGRRAPARLEALARRVPAAVLLSETVGRAVAISAQLAEGATARLHPELAELDRALNAHPEDETP